MGVLQPGSRETVNGGMLLAPDSANGHLAHLGGVGGVQRGAEGGSEGVTASEVVLAPPPTAAARRAATAVRAAQGRHMRW